MVITGASCGYAVAINYYRHVAGAKTFATNIHNAVEGQSLFRQILQSQTRSHSYLLSQFV